MLLHTAYVAEVCGLFLNPAVSLHTSCSRDHVRGDQSTRYKTCFSCPTRWSDPVLCIETCLLYAAADNSQFSNADDNYDVKITHKYYPIQR